MKTKYEQIVDIDKIASFNSIENIREIISLGRRENLKEISKDANKNLLIAIDIQNDFMEGIGSLGVAGSKGDVERLTRWIYQNVSKISHVICSLDSHSIFQIFHADWWRDANGNPPSPFTIITHKDVIDKRWTPIYGENGYALTYLEKLEQMGNKQLCIWPYHCLTGTNGAKLENEFTKMLYFLSAARGITPSFIMKGQDPNSEMYGIIKAEYDITGHVNQDILDSVERYDNIYIAGEASSHCVLASIIQILEYFEDRKDITSRITLLKDCTSPIAGFEESTKLKYLELIQKYGIKLKKSTDVIL